MLRMICAKGFGGYLDYPMLILSWPGLFFISHVNQYTTGDQWISDS